jgi:hypothetical protein
MMVGVKWAAGILKETLGLSEEDIELLKQYIEQLKCEGPALAKRAEMSERRTLIIAKCLKMVYPDQWAAAENEVKEQYKAAAAKRKAEQEASKSQE